MIVREHPSALSEENYLLSCAQSQHFSAIDISRFFGSNWVDPRRIKQEKISSDSATPSVRITRLMPFLLRRRLICALS
jgi:hypothetical protein